jgi:hypothetical protein
MATDRTEPTPTVYLTLSQVARLFPPSRGGRPTHVATITRWATVGVPLRDGTRLRLCAVRAPGRWLVTPDAVAEFIDRLTADHATSSASSASGALPATGAAPPRTPPARRRAAEREGRELDALSIK